MSKEEWKEYQKFVKDCFDNNPHYQKLVKAIKARTDEERIETLRKIGLIK